MSLRNLNCFLFLIVHLGLTSCSTMLTNPPITPTVELRSIKPVKLGFREQELAFFLDVDNPNDYDLSLQSLSFIAQLEGNEVARGVSNKKVTLPAKGNAAIEIKVNTRMDKVLGRLLLFAGQEIEPVNYEITGFVKLTNWPLRIPFNVEGSVSN